MKSFFFSAFVVFILAMLPITIHAQLVGRSSGGQSPGKEVAGHEINAGSLSGDVNLFTGTYNTSYSLGTVSTLSGLSFTATMSYNSSFSSGDNMPHLSGVPYGEGWSLALPSINISTEDYNKFSLMDMATLQEEAPGPRFSSGNSNCGDAQIEGRLYWYAPVVNIPGVGGGRMVYKLKDGNEHVFVLNHFERYMEARLNMTTLRWRVILDDGTEYQFKYLTMSHRNPTNQRLQIDCMDTASIKNVIMPKSEILNWHCDLIRSPNHVDSIVFDYKTYGSFNYFKAANTAMKTLVQNYMPHLTLASNFLDPMYKDVFIDNIHTKRDSLVFRYGTIATGAGVKLPDATFTTVDALYSKKTVVNFTGNGITNWRRYYHAMSDKVSTSCARLTASGIGFGSGSQNPYVFNPSNFGAVNGKFSIFETVNGSIIGLPFDHGYLESPIIRFSTNADLVTGELYEVAIDINNSGTLQTLFDINLATGDQGVTATPTAWGNGGAFSINADCRRANTGEQVFSTFGQGIKWPSLTGASFTTSNFFQMANLPSTHDGIYIQVGPSNSDTNYGKVPGEISEPANQFPITRNTYFQALITDDAADDALFTPNAIIRSGVPVSGNFGIGAPWFMLQKRTVSNLALYKGFADVTDPFSDSQTHWGNERKDSNGGGPPPNCLGFHVWSNQPTRAGSSVKMNSSKLIRYSKKPYMLQSVVYRVKNGSNTWASVSKADLGYEIKTVNNYAPAVQASPITPFPDINVVTNPSRLRNIVLLRSISQKAPDGAALALSQTPTTRFTYKKLDPVIGGLTSIYPLNGNYFIMDSTISPFGTVTTIEYYPLIKQGNDIYAIRVKPDSLSYMAINYRYNLRPSEYKQANSNGSLGTCTGAGLPSSTTRMGRSYAYQTYMVVKTKKVYEREPVGFSASGGSFKIWKYEFDSIVLNNVDIPHFSDKFTWDQTNNSIQVGFRKATVTGPNEDVVGGPVATYRHHTNQHFWGKIYNIVQKTNSGVLVSNKNINYQFLLAFNKPWKTQNPVPNPHFPPVKNGSAFVTLDMPFFYETVFEPAITTAKPEYLQSFFVKMAKDTTVTYEQTGGANTVVNEYDYFDADNTLSTNSLGYKAILGGNLPITLTFEPSWQLYSKKTYSTAYLGVNALYAQEENFYLYDLANKAANQTSGAVNTSFKNLWYAWKYQMRNIPFETRSTNKPSFSDGPKVLSSNVIYKKFFETGGDALTGRLLPAAMWSQMDSLNNQAIMDFPSANSFKEKVTWKYLRTDTILGYMRQNLQPTFVEDALTLRSRTVFNTITGLPTKQIVGAGLTDSLTTTLVYNNDNTLSSATYDNGLAYSYTYDKMKRPTTVKRNTSTLLARTQYSQFNGQIANASSQARTNLNFKRQTQFTTATDTILTTQYYDHQGRKVGVVRDGYIVENNVFDIWDRVTMKIKPVAGTTPVTGITGYTSTNLQYQYETMPRARVTKSAKYGQPIATGKAVNNTYSMISSAALTTLLTAAGQTGTLVGSNFISEELTDEDNKKMQVITNLYGQKVAEITGSGTAATLYYYNNTGGIQKVINPKGQASTYRYNYAGQLYRKDSPDEGTILYAYNRAGQILADKNALGETRVFQYDVYGRMIQQRYLPVAVNTTTLFNNNGFPWLTDPTLTGYAGFLAHASAVTEKKWFYNAYDSGSYSLFTTQVQTFLTGGGQTNARGRLAQAVSYNTGGQPIRIQLLSYNTDGFYSWEIQQFSPVSITTSIKGNAHKIDYTAYNIQGSLLTQKVDMNYTAVNAWDMFYNYTYDKRNRLKDLYVSYTDNGLSGRKVVTYNYDDVTDLIKSKYFFDRLPDGTCVRAVDTVNYVYDTRYRLTAINSRTMDYALTYDATQPANSSGNTVTTNYNGNINGIFTKYKLGFAGTVAGFTDGTVYTYTYDALNRLTLADAKVGRTKTFANLAGNELKYGDNSFTFDRIGNFTNNNIWMLNASQVETEFQWQYNYTAGKNWLTSIQNLIGSPTFDRTVTYDAAGRQTTDTKRKVTVTGYRPSNLVWSHALNPTTPSTVLYFYDHNDSRIYKENFVTATDAPISREYYLRNVFGQDLAILNQMGANPVVTSWYVPGREREARFPDERFAGGISGLSSGGHEEAYRTAATSTDVADLNFPVTLYLVSPHDTLRPLGYLLQKEASTQGQALRPVQQIIVTHANQRLYCTDTLGQQPRLVTMADILAMRESGEPFRLEGYATDCSEARTGLEFSLPVTQINPRYYIYDHLGNTRIIYSTDVPATCTGATTYTLEFSADYTPYGRLLRSFTISTPSERYLTTQHERDAETGYDNRGVRLYDSETGRFISTDPLGGKYMGWSTYNYVMGNPVIFVDPNGKEIKPSAAFAASRYGAVYNNLMANSTAYRSMTQIFTDKKTSDKFHYVLDYQNYIDPTRKEVGLALGKTRDLGRLNFDGHDNPTGGEQTTFFIPQNETGGDATQLNDVGRALVVLHEAIHADINATDTKEFGLFANHHDEYTDTMHEGIVNGLTQFNAANGLGLSPEQIGLVAWNGLQGSPLFNETFGLNPDSADYQTKLNGINNQINSIIYNSQNNEDEKNRYNLKN